MNFTGIKEREKMEDIHFNLFALYAAICDLRALRLLVGSVFNYRIKGMDKALPDIPAWQFDPSMLVRDRPVIRQMRRAKSESDYSD